MQKSFSLLSIGTTMLIYYCIHTVFCVHPHPIIFTEACSSKRSWYLHDEEIIFCVLSSHRVFLIRKLKLSSSVVGAMYNCSHALALMGIFYGFDVIQYYYIHIWYGIYNIFDDIFIVQWQHVQPRVYAILQRGNQMHTNIESHRLTSMRSKHVYTV